MTEGPGREKTDEWYDEDYFRTFPVWPRRIRQILRNVEFDASDRVCEFGCGLGHILFEVQARISRGLGIDVSAFAIEQAEKRRRALGVDNLEFRKREIRSLVSDASVAGAFSKVLMMDISEHLYDDTLSAFFRSARHILEPGGELVLHTPNAGYYLERLKARGWILKQFPSHVAVRGREAYETALAACGFRIRCVEVLPHYHIAVGAVDRVGMRLPFVSPLFRSRLLIHAQRP